MTKRSVLILVGPDYEEMEVWYPSYRLEAAGYSAPLAGIGEKSYRGKYGYPCPVDGQVRDFKADTLAGVLAPGGWAPDKIRRDPAALELVRQVNAAGGLVATICRRGPKPDLEPGAQGLPRVRGSAHGVAGWTRKAMKTGQRRRRATGERLRNSDERRVSGFETATSDG
jgi:protease I